MFGEKFCETGMLGGKYKKSNPHQKYELRIKVVQNEIAGAPQGRPKMKHNMVRVQRA